jgi:hypothetical protein
VKIGFIPLLTLIFVIAKIAGYIDWSWWLVFSPVLGLLGVVACILMIAGLLWSIENKVIK